MKNAILTIWYCETILIFFLVFSATIPVVALQHNHHGRRETFQVAVYISLTTGLSPENTEVAFKGLEPPYENYFGIAPADGIIVFSEVEQGRYNIEAYKPGYDVETIGNMLIDKDMRIDILLLEKKYPPAGLHVDERTLLATWSSPQRVALDEGFEGLLFPPEGWHATTLGEGWFSTYDGSTEQWIIPPWDSKYACSIDRKEILNNGCCDYLITPPLDLRESDGYVLSFDSFYDGALGQSALVEYSLDTGVTWNILHTLTPADSWNKIEIGLPSFCGENGPPSVWFAFHADDNGNNASGWAIDNVRIFVPAPPANFIEFYVFLDGAIIGYTFGNSWDFTPLIYNRTYTASVSARYTSGLSEKHNDTFICHYLVPPQNLSAASIHDSALLVWDPPQDFYAAVIMTNEIERMDFPVPQNEYSPSFRIITGGYTSRSPWELQLSFPTVSDQGEAGAETDGQFLYSSMWNSLEFHKYNLDGSFIEEFTIDNIGYIRDMAYDPSTSHTFGSDVSNIVHEWNFNTGEYIGALVAPTEVRAIAYDEQWDAFWANNWSSNITLFDKNGVHLNSFPVGSFGHYYGLAYDKWSHGGPYLYGYSQDGSGNLIVQIEIATGQETGLVVDLNEVLPLGMGIAGGLFTHYSIYGETISIGGVSQNDTYFIFELLPNIVPPGTVPENLTGYNVYRDNIFVMFNPHTGGYQYPEQQMACEAVMLPGIYSYKITGVYDLAPYGLPGQTDESLKKGPATSTVRYCTEMPFLEEWASGTFESHSWDIDGINWFINGQAGNPPPSAEFKWDPLQVNYALALTSYPLCAYDMRFGEIWLDYDLKLINVNNTGSEHLFIEAWNWIDHEWMTVSAYHNLSGNIDWTEGHVNITPHAMGNVFRVRFRAAGSNTLNIMGWFLDNIQVYRICDAPVNLVSEADLEQMAIILNWQIPVAGDNQQTPTRYNIYRSVNNGSYDLLDTTAALTYTDAGLPLGIFCYQVSATWKSQTDECESPPSNETCELLVDIWEPENNAGHIIIFPNPAYDYVTIHSNASVKRVTVYNVYGALLHDEITSGLHYKLSINHLSAGVYFIKMETHEDYVMRAITIQR